MNRVEGERNLALQRSLEMKAEDLPERIKEKLREPITAESEQVLEWWFASTGSGLNPNEARLALGIRPRRQPIGMGVLR